MSKVKAISGVPTIHEFYGSQGTPLVIDAVGKKGYFLDFANNVQELGGGTGGGLTDGDKGDIVVSGSGTILTIDNGVVTLAKQANVATGTVFYRKTTGNGSPEVQTLATLKTDLGVSALEPANFSPATMTVNTGTLDGGTVSSLTSLDGNLVSISEATGADPLRVTFTFTGVTRLTSFDFFGYYAGSVSHQLAVEIYNVNTTNWDSLGTMGSTTAAQWYSFLIHSPSSYINAGAVSTRLRHVQSGSPSHDLYLDHLELSYGPSSGSSNVLATEVTIVPSGTISATNVGAALTELDTEKEVAGTTASHASLTTGVHGAGANNFVYSNDSRLTDSRNAADVSAWAKAATKPAYTYSEVGAEQSGAVSTHAALTTGVHGAGANSLIYSNDSRLTDARTPTTHDSSKHSVTYAVPGDITTHGNLTTGVHGAGANNFVYSNDSRLTDARTPTAHNQAESTITFTDITTGNTSVSAHGYFPKLPTASGKFLRDDLSWQTVSGTGDVVGDDTATTAQNIVAYNTTGGKNITELTGTQGDILYHNGTSWQKLGYGTSGYFLRTQGASANPKWWPDALFNQSTADQGAGFATDTYITGSNILIPSGALKVGTRYYCMVRMTKTAAGTATPIVNIRFGTNASTADTSRGTLTWTAGTAAIDDGILEVFMTVTTAGASGVIRTVGGITHKLSVTGLIGTAAVSETEVATSGTFDQTVANSYIGLSLNAGTAAAWTLQMVQAKLENLA